MKILLLFVFAFSTAFAQEVDNPLTKNDCHKILYDIVNNYPEDDLRRTRGINITEELDSLDNIDLLKKTEKVGNFLIHLLHHSDFEKKLNKEEKASFIWILQGLVQYSYPWINDGKRGLWGNLCAKGSRYWTTGNCKKPDFRNSQNSFKNEISQFLKSLNSIDDPAVKLDSVVMRFCSKGRCIECAQPPGRIWRFWRTVLRCPSIV